MKKAITLQHRDSGKKYTVSAKDIAYFYRDNAGTAIVLRTSCQGNRNDSHLQLFPACEACELVRKLIEEKHITLARIPRFPDEEAVYLLPHHVAYMRFNPEKANQPATYELVFNRGVTGSNPSLESVSVPLQLLQACWLHNAYDIPYDGHSPSSSIYRETAACEPENLRTVARGV